MLASSWAIKISLSLYFLQSATIGVLFLIRQPSKQSYTFHWLPTIAAWATVFSPLLLNVKNFNAHPFGTLFNIIGSLFTLWGAIALNKAFSVIPADRGVKTGGPYRFVRHPIYASYWIAGAGVIINSPSTRNLIIIAFSCLLQLPRIYFEEKLLDSNAEYREYKKRVRWKLIPYVF